MQVHDQIATMDAQQLREFAAGLIDRVARQDDELRCKQLKIEQLTHEMALLKRWKFAARSEQLHGLQAACSRKRSTRIWKRLRRSSTRCRLSSPPSHRRTNRSERRYRRICPGSKSATSRK
jgi:hypothetical protein